MSNDCWFECTVCNEKVFDSKHVWVPICLTCEKDIENYYFHENCVYEIYNHSNNNIKAECENEYCIVCKKCKVNENIGFDSKE